MTLNAMASRNAPMVPTRCPTHLPEEVLRRLDTPGPRYTSYPTADRFGADIGPETARAAWALRAGDPRPLSVYVHIPFCESVCYYCACNKIVTKHHGWAAAYLDALDAEIGLITSALQARARVSQLHLGGGTPTFLSDGELARLMASLRQAFEFEDDAEISIEIDPRTIDADRLAFLRALGFNRISLGVQDFDVDVQRAVHRIQPFEAVHSVMQSARGLGFESINADLIYGLPRQTGESFQRTLQQLLCLRPDRIALYAYAHLPERFKPQRRIVDQELPVPAQRLALLDAAVSSFVGAGYAHIGMDHFALPEDSLAKARDQGRLQRNFQGYSTQPDRDLVGLGVSAIGRVGATYVQNHKTLPEYLAAVQAGKIPAARGLTLDADDELRRELIMSLMCQGRIDIASVQARHGLPLAGVLADALPRLKPLQQAGLVKLDEAAIELTPIGWYAVRAVAMTFDRHLQGDLQDRACFSRVV